MRDERNVLVFSLWRKQTLAVCAALSLALVALAPLEPTARASVHSDAAAVTGSPAELTAVTAVPHSDGLWAVGQQCSTTGDGCIAGTTYVTEWNGSNWSRTAAPSPSGSDDALTGVSASSATNAWAVGSYAGSSYKNLLLHWNGRTWGQVSAPNLEDNVLHAVSTLSAGAAWAAGTYSLNSTDQTLMLAWNGEKWSRVATPDPSAGDNELYGVSAISPTNAWSVGYELDMSTSQYHSLVLHWNGSTWQQVESPAATGLGQLMGVAASSANSVWAVGYVYNGNTLSYAPLLLHWNGTTWTRMTLGVPKFNMEDLLGVAAASPSNAWAVGTGPCVGQSVNCPSHSLTFHWNGHAWSHVASPSTQSNRDTNTLAGVAITGSAAIGVGSYFYAAPGGAPVKALLLRWNGKQWVEQ